MNDPAGVPTCSNVVNNVVGVMPSQDAGSVPVDVPVSVASPPVLLDSSLEPAVSPELVPEEELEELELSACVLEPSSGGAPSGAVAAQADARHRQSEIAGRSDDAWVVIIASSVRARRS